MSSSGDYGALNGVTTDEDDEEDSGEYLVRHNLVRQRSADSEQANDEHTDDVAATVVGAPAVGTFFDLNVDGTGPDLRLSFSLDAIRRVRLFVACSPGLAEATHFDVLQRFRKFAVPGTGARTVGSGYVILRPAFDTCVRTLCFSGVQTAAGERVFVNHLANIIFKYFEVDNGDGGAAVPFPEIALALGVFTPIKKSAKLGLTFDVLGRPKPGKWLEDAQVDDQEDEDDENRPFSA